MGVATKMTSQTTKQAIPRVAPDKSFTKRVIHAGSGLVRPNEGSVCVVRIAQSGDLVPLDEALIGYPLEDEVTIRLGDGEGEMSHIIETCLEMMLPGETCQIEVAMETVRDIFKKRIQNPLNSKQDDASSYEPYIQQLLVLEIELKSFVRDKDIHQMTVEDKLDRATNFKVKGSSCFSCGKLEKAEQFYIRALKYIITIDPLEIADASEVIRERLNTLKCACLLNIAACKLKYKCYEHVISHCTKALAIDSSNAKGLFRRGVAYMELQEYEKAKADLDQAVRLEPVSKPLKQQRQVLQERMKALDTKYARAMSKMFGGQ